MAKLYHPDVTQWLQLSGQYIVQNLPIEERVPWVFFLIDEMKQFMPEDEYETLLADMQAELKTRQGEDEA